MRFIGRGLKEGPDIDMLMGEDNRSIIEMLYPGITKETCRSACRDVYSYRISDKIQDTTAKAEFWLGSREPYPAKAARLLKRHVPAMTEKIFPEMGRCQFLHEQPKEYAILIDSYMNYKDQ